MKECAVIIIQGIADIDKLIDYNNERITLRQVLSSLRTSACWEMPIFTQVHFCQKIEEFIGICHKNEKQEALFVKCDMLTRFECSCVASYSRRTTKGTRIKRAVSRPEAISGLPAGRQV